MNETIRVLQYGGTDLQPQYQQSRDFAWHHVLPGSLQDPVEEDTAFDAALFLQPPLAEDLPVLTRLLRPYTVFALPAAAAADEAQRRFYRSKQVQPLEEGRIEDFLLLLPLQFWRGQYGEKLRLADTVIEAPGRAVREGNVCIRLEGNFGEHFVPCISWRSGVPLRPDRPLELWPEYEVTEGDLQLQMVVRIYQAGFSDRLLDEIVCEADLQEPLVLGTTQRGTVNVNYRIRGKGCVRIGALHIRQSRLMAGCLQPGGVRHVDERRQEFYTYFDPGDLRPPLVVYFSGYRTAEGFEGHQLMRSLGTPFLLVGDPRIEGGCFYLGSQEYEQKLADAIRSALDYLDFDEGDLVVTGLSMGSFGALYYGARLGPHALVLGKPMTQLGQVARSARHIRPDDFLTALDAVYALTGGSDTAHTELLDERIRRRLLQGSFENTVVAIAYMRQDDYDRDAYERILHELEERKVRVYGKGIDGRHNDNSPAVTQWFLLQLQRILREDFGRTGADVERAAGRKETGAR